MTHTSNYLLHRKDKVFSLQNSYITLICGGSRTSITTLSKLQVYPKMRFLKSKIFDMGCGTALVECLYGACHIRTAISIGASYLLNTCSNGERRKIPVNLVCHMCILNNSFRCLATLCIFSFFLRKHDRTTFRENDGTRVWQV